MISAMYIPVLSLCSLFSVLVYFRAGLPLVSESPVSHQWSKVSQHGDSPAIRGEFAAVYLSGKVPSMLIHGGCDLSFSTFYNDTWTFELTGSEWSKMITIGNAPATCGHGAVLMTKNSGRVVYVYGGISPLGDASDLLYELNLSSRVWTLIDDKDNMIHPPPRTLLQHSMVSVDASTFAVVSGTTSKTYQGSDDESTWFFNIQTLKWRKASRGQDGDVNVGGSAATMLGDKLVVSGGFRSDLALEQAVLKITAKGLASSGEYSSLPQHDSLSRLAFHAALSHQGCLLLISGFNATNVNPLVWVLNPVSNAWTILDIDGDTPPPHFASGVVGDGVRYAWLYGGRVNPNGREMLVGDMYRLDLGSLKCATGELRSYLRATN